MGRKNRETGQVTNLFSLVDSMQRRLEAEGLDSDVVDLAVTRGLQTLFRPARRGTEHSIRNLFLSTFAVPAQT